MVQGQLHAGEGDSYLLVAASRPRAILFSAYPVRKEEGGACSLAICWYCTGRARGVLYVPSPLYLQVCYMPTWRHTQDKRTYACIAGSDRLATWNKGDFVRARHTFSVKRHRRHHVDILFNGAQKLLRAFVVFARRCQ